MNKNEFATLVEGDTFMVATMPKQTFKVARIQTEFDYTQSPPTKRTWAIETENGRYLKNFDKEVQYAHLIPKAGDLIKVLESTNPHIPSGSLLLAHGEAGKPVGEYFKATLSDKALIQDGYIYGPGDIRTEIFLWRREMVSTYNTVSFPFFEAGTGRKERFMMNGDVRLFQLDELPLKA